MNSKISVIMPVYNAEKFIKDSIESILNQTYKNFEFIIVNDGSIDSSLKIIKEYKEKDNRIKIIDQKNTGVIGALNIAIKNSNGDYICRMDADDVSLENRLEKLLNYIEKENAYLCGSYATIINNNGKETGKKFTYPPLTWIKNKLYLIRGNPFIHPTVIFKKEVYEKEKDKDGNLYKNYKNVEDYELWTRIIPKYKSINIGEYLLKYRVHDEQVTKKVNLDMRIKGIKIRSLALIRLIFQ